MRSPIKWPGGKARMAARLLELAPPHDHYVEVFGGSAAMEAWRRARRPLFAGA